MNGKLKDYTFYSHVHRTYSRLDYILIEHGLLERVVDAKIGIATLRPFHRRIGNANFSNTETIPLMENK